jgi:hypothetical protein
VEARFTLNGIQEKASLCRAAPTHERDWMSNYFVLMNDKSLVGKFAYFDDEPDAYDITAWISGMPIQLDGPLALRSCEDYDSVISDVLLTRIPLFAFSAAVRQLLKNVGVNNIEYHPLSIEKHDSGEILDSHLAANILGCISCLDSSASKISLSRQTGRINRLKKFALIEASIKPTTLMDSEALLFRLEEFPFLVLAHQRVKDAIENSGVSGFKFVEPEKYIGV